MDYTNSGNFTILNNISKVPPALVSKEVKCEVCNLSVSSYIVLRDHREGRKHKNQLKLLIRSKNIDLNCVICSIISKNYDDWELHVTSEKHVENTKRYKPITAVTIPPPAQLQSAQSIPPLLPPRELEELTAKFQANLNQQFNQKSLQQTLATEQEKPSEWNCRHCSVTCQSLCSWNAHLASHRHRKNQHKFHTYPGISKDYVKKKYQNSFVRAAETLGNEFIQEGVVFYCKRCNVRIPNKLQLEGHMSSSQHKNNHPILPAEPYPVQNKQQLFNFESSSYGYGVRNWSVEQNFHNSQQPPPSEFQEQQDIEKSRQLVEEAKNELLARFPFYAISQNSPTISPADIPMPVEAPKQVYTSSFTQLGYEFDYYNV